MRFEARFDLLQIPKALDQQAGARKQNERERNFSDDKRASKRLPARVLSTAAAFFQRFIQIGARSFKRRRQPEHDAGYKRKKKRKGQHASIDSYFINSRNPRRGD